MIRRLGARALLMLPLAASGWLAIGCASAPAQTASLPRAEFAVLSNGGLAGSAAAEVNNALQTLVQQCMQSKGLTFYPDFQTAADDTSAGPSLAGLPQAYIGLAAREADGYGFYSKAARGAAAPGDGQGVSQEDHYIDTLPANLQGSYMLAFQGPENSRVTITLPGGAPTSAPAGGCLGTAEKRIYGTVGNFLLGLTGAGILRNTLLDAVTADPAFGTATSGWSSCMNKLGYKYDNPESLWNTLGSRIDKAPTPAMRDLEIKTAVTDYKCAASVKLIPAITSLQAQHASQLSGTLLQNLASITQIETTALNNARSLHLAS